MRDHQTVGIGILGYGTVGAGVYQLLERQRENLPAQTGLRGEVVKVLVRDASKPREGIPGELLTDRIEDIIEDESIDIVVEVMGGIEPARTYITSALLAGKNVVTANKDLIAAYGSELLQLASEMKKDLLYEASVAGGIPIIRPMNQCLAGNQISRVIGIVNGTTNYILTKMTEEDMEFSDALDKATELGYAEADPTADIEAYDAGRKIAILASLAFHSKVTFADVYTEGITKVTAADIRYGKEMGCMIKLLAIAKETPEGVEASVQPMLVPKNHPLASVNDVFNAVFIHGDAVDDIMFYGRGAGRFPTASACVGDVLDIMRNIKYQCNGRIACRYYRQIPVKPMSATMQNYFLRMQIQDKPGVLGTVASVMGEHGVSIKQMVQKPTADVKLAELVLITDTVCEADFMEAMDEIKEFDTVKEISSIIRVLDA
jgi:homoserine dehydrogenase